MTFQRALRLRRRRRNSRRSLRGYYRTRMSPLLLVPILATSVAAEGGFTLSQPGQFVVEKVAGDELAHYIYSIAIDARGRVHVSGPGYIRRLVDADADG